MSNKFVGYFALLVSTGFIAVAIFSLAVRFSDVVDILSASSVV